MLMGFERLPSESIDDFFARINARVEECRDVFLEVQGPSMVPGTPVLTAVIQLGKVEAVMTPQGPVPSFKQSRVEDVTKKLEAKRSGKGPLRLSGN